VTRIGVSARWRWAETPPRLVPNEPTRRLDECHDRPVHLADAAAARLLGGGRPLADALATLERGTQAAPMAVNPAFASLYIANIRERVRRLLGFDEALAREAA